MIRNLSIDLDLSKVGKDMKVQLAMPNKKIKQNIKNITNATLDGVELNGLPTFTFEIPHKIEKRVGQTSEFEYVNNPDIKNIKEKMLIKLTWYNKKRVNWFRVTKITQTDSQEFTNMKIEADALPSELRATNVSIDFESVDVVEYFNHILQDTAWTLGTVSDSLKNTFRSFEETKKTRYEGTQDGLETYGAIADWNDDARVLNLLSMSDIRKFKGVVLKKENYMSSLEVVSDAEDIVTRLYVKGNENLGIETVNPTGMPYIEDFSYFMYPFERDANKNVLTHSHYMSDELCHAILDLKVLQDEYNPKIKELQGLINDAYNNLSQAMIDKTTLDGQLITLQALLDTAKATNDEDLVYQREMEIRDKTAEVNSKQQDIDNMNDSIELWETTIQNYQSIISTSSFTTELRDELSLFVYEQEFSDDRYIEAQELFDAGKEQFEKYQQPIKSFTIELASFIGSLESQHLNGRLEIGEEVLIKSKNLETEYTSIVLGYNVDFSSGDYNLIISDNMDDINSLDKLATLIYKADSSSTILNNNKYKWDNVTSIKDEVEMWRDKEIKAVENRIIAGANESITIDNRGIQAHNPDFPNERIIIQSGVVALSKDGGQTWSTSMTPDGVIAETLIGKILAGNNLIITNDQGSFVIDSTGMTIDMDSIKIMSGDSGTPEDMIQQWNNLLLTYSEIASDNLVNKYEKNQLTKQWETIVGVHSSMLTAFNKGWGDSQEPKPTEYNQYITAYEALRTYLNTTKQGDGYALLDPANKNNTTTINPTTFNQLFKDYETKKQSLESIISLEFTKSQIEILETGISLQYVKNNNIVTQLNLSEEGVKIDGKLLEINSDTEFNANLTMNAGVIKGKDNGIIIDLNEGTMTLNKPIQINAGSNVATKEDIEKAKITQTTVVLTNESATVPTDKDGNNGDFTTATTDVMVFVGSVDDSANWAITATPSLGLTGTLTGKTYKVTALTTNTGRVTFTLTKGSQSFTKVFTIAKAKAGATGTGVDATSYWVTPSVNIVRRNVLGVLSPTTIVFNGYAKTGTQATVAYAGRFIIQTSPNGTTWTTVYTSASNVSTYTYTVSAGIRFVKVKMYLAGGTTSLLDEQTIPILDDAEGLEIGSRNYFSVKAWNSKPNLTASAVPYMDIQLEPNTQYTLSTNIPIQTNGQYDVFFFKGTDAPSSASNGVAKDLPRTITTNSDGIVKVAMRSYNLANGYWIMLAKGNKSLDWQPAIEDDMLFTAYSNSADGTKDFTQTYPNENLLVRKGELTQSIIDTSGNIVAGAGNNTSSILIPVTSGEVLYFSQSKPPTSTVCFRWRWLNANKVYVSRSSDASNQKFTVTVPSGVAYLQVSYSSTWDSKVERNSYSLILPSPQDNPVKSEMAYIGYSPINSNKPSDYIWVDNPKAKGTFIAYANSADGLVDFAREHLAYNQFSISNAVIDAYLGNYEYTFDFKSVTTAAVSFTHANPIKLKAGTYVFSYEGKIPAGQPSVASLRFSTSTDNINFTTLSGVGYLGQTKLTSEWTKFTATATLTQDMYIGIQVYSHMFGTDYNTKVDVRNIVIREGSNATFMPSPKDDAVRAEMKYMGYSSKDSDNPLDYVWSENPKTKGNIVRYANSADGTKDFTAIYPNENLFPNTKLLDTKDVNASMDTVIFNGDETVTLRKKTVTTSRMFWNNSPVTNIQPDPNRVYSAQIDIFIENGFTSIAGSSFFLRSYNSSGTAMDFATVDLAGIPSNQWVTLKIANAKPNGGTIPSKGMQFCVALANNALGTIRLRKPKLEYGAINTFQNTNKNEDPARAEMAYIGYSFKDSENPADFTWYENPRAKGTYKRWANSPDGKVDFTDTYPNPNLFDITRPEVRNPATTSAEFLNNQNWDMAPIFDTYGANVPYTLSFDLKSDIAGGISVYSQNGSGTKYNIGQTTVSATTEFQRFSLVIVPQLQTNTNPQTQALLAFYGTYNTGRIPTVRNLKLEFGAKQTIDTPSVSEDLLATIPQYVGVSNKDSNNPADYVWSVTPEYTQARTDLGLDEKADQKDLDDVRDTADHANNLGENSVQQNEFYSWLEDDYTKQIDEMKSISEQSQADLQNIDGRTALIESNLGNMSEKWNFIDTSITMAEEGILISDKADKMSILVSSGRIVFFDNEVEVAYITSQMLNISRGVFLESATIGNHVITKYSNTSPVTIIRYVGDVI